MSRLANLVAIWLALVTLGHAQDMTSGASPARDSARPSGYLTHDEIPDAVSLLPPPPAPGSIAFALDEEKNRQALTLRGTDRWDLAARDAIPDPGAVFACALGFAVTKKDTPNLSSLLRRSAADVIAAVTPTKKLYQRKRPFLVNDQPICVPGSEEATGRDGSYPSGHTAAGWIWALILAEIAPDRTDAVLARGWEFGQSRAVCNVHWQSDLTYGRVVGTTLLARLHANEEFLSDLENARDEIDIMRTRNSQFNRDCEAEARALSKPRDAEQK